MNLTKTTRAAPPGASVAPLIHFKEEAQGRSRSRYRSPCACTARSGMDTVAPQHIYGLSLTFDEANVGMALESDASNAIMPILRIDQRKCARATYALNNPARDHMLSV